MLSNTRPFIGELERALPSRPFSVQFWDGSRLASTNGGGPTFSVRSPQAIAHVLRAPGQLGLGRAYVSGELTVDDLDEALELLDSWESPPLDRRAEERGLADRVDIRVMDYRELAGEPFDAVASIGMVEHVGSSQIDVYARQVARFVKPSPTARRHACARPSDPCSI